MKEHPTDIDDLHRRVQAGWRPKFMFFWGHVPARPHVLGSECFSQWYPAPFVVEGVQFPTAEHFMMWSKARLFNDDAMAAQILAARSPAAAKRLGRSVHAF